MKARRAESRNGYTVRGRSLAGLLKDIALKCPRDPFGVRRSAGGCSVEIKHDLDDKDLKFETKAGSSPVEVKATLTGGTMLCVCQIMVPKIASEKTVLDKKYDKTAIAVRIKLAARLYNAKTKNGAAKGAALNTKINDE